MERSAHTVSATGKVTTVKESVTAGSFSIEKFSRNIKAKVAAGYAKRPNIAKKERVYAVSLFVNSDANFGDVSLCMATEQWLARAAKSESESAELRWSTPDWAYFDCAPDFAKIVFPEKRTRAMDKAIYEAMLAALRSIRKQVGPEVILNVVCGDMSKRFFCRGLEALNSKARAKWALSFPLP